MGTTSAKKKLLLIGAGPTSSLICYNIAKSKNLVDALDIHVWEKAKGTGGRFSTSRSSSNPDCYLDLGAQYLTLSQNHPSSKTYFDSLKLHQLVRPFETANIPGFRNDSLKSHFSCIKGAASIVKHFFDQASIRKAEIKFSHRVSKIVSDTTGKVEVTADNGATESFDLVISTMPAPQILQLENVPFLITDNDLREKLGAVKYSTRFALGLFFDSPVQLKSSDKPINFVDNDSIIRYWSIENLKRDGSHGGPTSVVIHTNVDYGERNADIEKDAMKPEILQRVIETIVPEAANIPKDVVKSHKWRYSQVLIPFVGKPGCVKLANQVYASGDSFSESGLEGCIDSAEQTMSVIRKYMNLFQIS